MTDDAAPLEPAAHRRLAVGYFNAAWDLIDLDSRTPEQTRDMIAATLASRQHWVDAGGGVDKIMVADWQVAHAASLAGLPDLAMVFASAAVAAADGADGTAFWMKASAHEGLARAHAAAGNRAAYDAEAAICRSFLDAEPDEGERQVIAAQLASIPVPQ